MRSLGEIRPVFHRELDFHFQFNVSLHMAGFECGNVYGLGTRRQFRCLANIVTCDLCGACNMVKGDKPSLTVPGQLGAAFSVFSYIGFMGVNVEAAS